ncbi:MAG: transposase [Pseudobdellovibrio sp.]
MAKLLKVAGKSNRKPRKYVKKNDALSDQFETIQGPIDTQHLLISTLLPPAVKMFIQELEKEVDELCGTRYRHSEDQNYRWGSQKGSIILGNQHVAIEKPRVRSAGSGKEVRLQTYEDFQDPKIFESKVFAEGLKKVSQRDYEKGLSTIAGSFGFKKSSVSRKWIKATAKKLDELQNRSLSELDIRTVFIDGKRFHKQGVIVALGIAASGRKYILGIYQSSSENSQACRNLLNDLEKRGLPESGLIFVVDGGSGLNKALEQKYAVHDKKERRAIRIRCHIHKWWNLEKCLGDDAHKAKGLFWALRDAKDMTEARDLSARLESVLRDTNVSALKSYLEAKNDLLALHEFKLSKNLKRLLSTTNPIESLNSLIEEDMRRVKNWKDSSHFQRWLATYCLNSESKMRKVRGHNALPALWVEVKNKVEQKDVDTSESTEEVA